MKNDEPNEAETIMHPYILCMFGCIFPDSVLFFFSVQLKKKKGTGTTGRNLPSHSERRATGELVG